ncbi:MAG: hypothetical protein WBN08_05560 [Thiogranum sp.]
MATARQADPLPSWNDGASKQAITRFVKTYIVSGGGIEFMRPWAGRVYGIPPEQVVGSSIKTKYELRDGEPVLVRLPEINFIDDKAGKPDLRRKPVARFWLFPITVT